MIKPKPAHLGRAYGSQFEDAAIVAAYHHRPAYPEAVFPLLEGLMQDRPGSVLDVGCGTGDIARRLAPRVSRLDALDISERMVARGRTLPGGNYERLRWKVGAVEDAALDGPYALITAGESLHWMEWSIVLPRFASLLSPGGVLAILSREELASPWRDGLQPLLSRFSTNREFRPFHLVSELQERGLFTAHGECTTLPETVSQSVESYIETIHSRNGFSRDRMAPGDAAAFDQEVRELTRPWAENGRLSLRNIATVAWGAPGTS